MRTLDRKKPFATVHGDDVNWAFEQDGRRFDSAGREVVEQESTGSGVNVPAMPPVPTFAPPPGESALPPQSSATGAMAMMDAAGAVLAKSAEEAIAELADLSDDMLPVLTKLETMGKARKTVLGAIEAEIDKRAPPPPPPPPAGSQPPADDQLKQQLGST